MASLQVLVVLLVQTVLAYWNNLDIPLQESQSGGHQMAVGVVNDTVFIAGGDKQLIKYAIDTEGALGNHTNVLNYFPDVLNCYGQAFVQHGNQLFIAHYWGPEIAVFDMAQQQYTSIFATVPLKYYMAEKGCFAHTGSHLVVTGGFDVGSGLFLNDVYTYNIGNGNWDNFIGDMNETRSHHSCVLFDGTIFTIAGKDNDGNELESIEYVNLNSPSQWFVLEESLERGGGMGTRSVVYQDYIVVIGGWWGAPNSNLTYILDPDDNSVHLGEPLPYGISYPACAVIQESIVCFGGSYSWVTRRHSILKYIDPTASPTAVPSANPSFEPSRSPTKDPTAIPTINPTKLPSVDPTLQPTGYPTAMPSANPTLEPTEVTTNPTRYPTVSITFEHVLEAEYKITNLTATNFNSFEPEAITKIIENSYVRNSNLRFKQFEIHEKSRNVTQNSLFFRTEINFNDDVVRTIIPLISTENAFVANATTELRRYFNNPFVVFSVVESPTIVDSQTMDDAIESLDYVLYGLGALLFASAIVSLFAMLQNKLPKSTIDNANWKMAMAFAWQMFDFVSDINLTIELALEVVDNQDILLIICAIGCALFVIVPFVTNLTMAARIKTLVAKNDAAVSYFDRNSALFVSLCIVSGAVYPSLQLVSSRLFGLDIFDSGLTSYELKKMIHLKVMGSVVLENVPQVMFQVLYIGYSEGIPSNVVLLSLIASLLSIVAALMTWIVERNASNCATVQYHIKIERKGKQLSKDARDTIKQKKERKKSLTKKLCQALSIQDRQMEIGYATINAFGFNYSVIHSVFPSEYGINSEGCTNPSDEEKANEHVLAMDYVKDLYAKQAQAAVTQVFLDYFDIVGFEVSVVPVSALYSVANDAVSSDASANIELHMSSTLGDPSDEKDSETISK